VAGFAWKAVTRGYGEPQIKSLLVIIENVAC